MDLLDIAEVTKLGGVVVRQEDVERFDVPVNDISRVQVLDAQADMDEHLPEEVIRKRLAILLPDRCGEVTVLAVLHDDAYRLISDE